MEKISQMVNVLVEYDPKHKLYTIKFSDEFLKSLLSIEKKEEK